MSESIALPMEPWRGAGALGIIIDGGVLLDVAHRTRTNIGDLLTEIGRLTDAASARVVISPAQRNRAERVEQILLDLWRQEELIALADDVTERIASLADRHPAAVIVAGLRVRHRLDRSGHDPVVVIPRRRRGEWVLEEVTPSGTSAVLSQIAQALGRQRGDDRAESPLALWACVEPTCDEHQAHPSHLVRDPQVGPNGSAQCPSCALPVVAIGDQRSTVGVWLTGPDGTRRLIRLAAGEPLVLGRTMSSGTYGLDRLGLTDEISSRISRRHVKLQVSRRGRRGRLALFASDAGATNGTFVLVGSRRDCLGSEPVELDERVRLELPGGITIRRSGIRATGKGAT